MPPSSPQHDSDKFDFEFDIGDSGATDKAKPVQAPEVKPEDEVIRKPRARQPAAAPPAKKKVAEKPDDDDLVIRRTAPKPKPKPAPAAQPRRTEPRPEPAADSQAVIRKRRTEPVAKPKPAPLKVEQHKEPVAEPQPEPQTGPVAREVPVSLPPVQKKGAVEHRPVPNPFTPESYTEEELHDLDRVEDVVIEPIAPPVDRRRREKVDTIQRGFQPSSQPAGQGRRIKPMLAIGVCLVAAAAIAAFIKLRPGGDEASATGGTSGDEPARTTVAPTGSASDPLPPAAGETLVDINSRITDTLGKYFGASAPSDLLPLLRHRERVAPLVDEYYQRKGFAMPALEAVGGTEEIMVNLKTFWMADVTLAGKLVRKVILDDTDRGFVVDWEEFVGYNPIDWEEFASTRPPGRTPFRVFATLDHRPGYAFPDPAGWLCVRLRIRSSEKELYGYVANGTELAAKLEEMLTNELEYPCILELEFPSNSKGGDDQLHIRDLVIEHWVVVD